MADSSRIDWCDASINPLGWGCWGPGGTSANPKRCHYCYAHRAAHGPWAAQRGCPDCQRFIPHWHPEAISLLSWLIVGADSTRGAKKPRKEWGTQLIKAAAGAGVPVFVKKNWPFLGQWPQQFPQEVGRLV